jgi:hypothetical protein
VAGGKLETPTSRSPKWSAHDDLKSGADELRQQTSAEQQTQTGWISG